MTVFASKRINPRYADIGSAAAPRYGGNLIVAIDLGAAILTAVMAIEDAVLCGLIDPSMLTDADGASDGETGSERGAPDGEDAYFEWLAEQWGYADGDVRRDALVSHFGRS